LRSKDAGWLAAATAAKQAHRFGTDSVDYVRSQLLALSTFLASRQNPDMKLGKTPIIGGFWALCSGRNSLFRRAAQFDRTDPWSCGHALARTSRTLQEICRQHGRWFAVDPKSRVMATCSQAARNCI